jgi:nicotinate phosphoribosyltransferase
MVDLATRAHNHNWRMDPIVRSLLDTDFYKLLMAQFIHERYPMHQVTFGLKNRTASVNLGKVIDIQELSDQLNYVRTLKFTKQELIWLEGATFYGQERIFKKPFIDHLRRLELPEFRLDYVGNGEYEDTDLRLTFTGSWMEVTFWEIYALAIVSELKTRTALKDMTKFELDVTYSCAKTKLWGKLQKLKTLEGLNLSDMGTRRRHSFLWQEWALQAAQDVLGDGFSGLLCHDARYGCQGHQRP